MLVLVTYDVNTTSKEGCRRLRHVSKVCVAYGQRVQCSVFECLVDYSQYLELKARLLRIIDANQDSIRFYRLGNKYETKVEHFGLKPLLSQDDTLII